MKQQKNASLPIYSVRLRELISKAGITQMQLAAETGVSQSAISHYVRGARATPRVEEVLALAGYFKISAEWLFGTDQSGSDDAVNRSGEDLDARDAELRTVVVALEEQVKKLRVLVTAKGRRRRREGQRE